jgi:hypothetical protein
MTRKLKTLGLALVAVFALGAISASTASATTEPIAHFTSSEYPSYIEGNQIGNHTLTTPVGTITCKKVHSTSKTHELTEASTSLRITPAYSECITKTALGATYPTTVTLNGCTYTFTVHEKGADEEGVIETPGGTLDSALTHTSSGDFHLICPKGVNGIEIHVYENATKHANNEPICTYTIGPQTIKSIHYAVNTAWQATYTTLETKESEMKINRTSGTFFNCGGVEPTAKYNGNNTVETLNSLGEMIEADIG